MGIFIETVYIKGYSSQHMAYYGNKPFLYPKGTIRLDKILTLKGYKYVEKYADIALSDSDEIVIYNKWKNKKQ